MYNQKRNNRLLSENRKQQLLEEISQEVYLRIICEQYGIDRSQLDEAGVRDTLKGLGLAAGMTLASLGGVKGQAVQPPAPGIEVVDTSAVSNLAKEVSIMFKQQSGLRLEAFSKYFGLSDNHFRNNIAQYKSNLIKLSQDLNAAGFRSTFRIRNVPAPTNVRRALYNAPGEYSSETIDIVVDVPKEDTLIFKPNVNNKATGYYVSLRELSRSDSSTYRLLCNTYGGLIAQHIADRLADNILRNTEGRFDDTQAIMNDITAYIENGRVPSSVNKSLQHTQAVQELIQIVNDVKRGVYKTREGAPLTYSALYDVIVENMTDLRRTNFPGSWNTTLFLFLKQANDGTITATTYSITDLAAHVINLLEEADVFNLGETGYSPY